MTKSGTLGACIECTAVHHGSYTFFIGLWLCRAIVTTSHYIHSQARPNTSTCRFRTWWQPTICSRARCNQYSFWPLWRIPSTWKGKVWTKDKPCKLELINNVSLHHSGLRDLHAARSGSCDSIRFQHRKFQALKRRSGLSDAALSWSFFRIQWKKVGHEYEFLGKYSDSNGWLFYLTMCTSDIVKEYGIAVRFLGNLSLLPPDVAEIAIRTEERTRHNTK